MFKLWNKHFLGAELILSIIITIGLYILMIALGFEHKVSGILSGTRQSLYSTVAAVTGALLGFVITGVSIVLTMGDSESLKILKMSSYYKIIFTTFISSSKFLAITTVLSLGGLIFDRDLNAHLPYSFLVFWATLISLFRLLRCVWVLEKLIELKCTDGRNLNI